MAVQHTAHSRRDDGFTLVEMMVALIVIAILVAIAIPTFLNARERAANRSAQAKVNTALKAHKAYAADNKPYADEDDAVDRLEAMEPSVEFLDGTALPPPDALVKGAVYVRNAAGVEITLLSRSSTGRCYWMHDVAGNTSYAATDCGVEPAYPDDFTAKPSS